MITNTTSRRRRMPQTSAKTPPPQDENQEGPAWFSLTRSTTMQGPVPSTLLADKAVENTGGILFEVPANHPEQKPILFGRYRREDFPRFKGGEDHGESDFSWVSPKIA